MGSFHRRRRVAWAGGCLALIVFFRQPTRWLMGQSLPVRTRSAEFTTFGMYSSLTPNYGPELNYGFTAGGDFTKLYKFTSLSLELRAKDANGPTVGEKTLAVGPRFEYRWTRVHAYMNLFVGAGKITFADKYARGSNGTGQNGSVVYSYGGGMDYDITGQWATRIDYQGEHWDLEEKPKILLFPNVFSIGIVCRLRFARDRSQW